MHADITQENNLTDTK